MTKHILTYIAILLGVTFTACTDDESFTKSTSCMLTFSADTISLDTVFARVPSITKTFWVYNNSGDGLRCSSIRLANGNQTGFRVNVNGVYLGASQGYLINDEEIRKGDSIRVFVEATTPTMNQKEPTLVTDDLIFTLESGLQQKVNLRIWGWDADLIDTLKVTRDTTLTLTRPMIINRCIDINEGKTLTIAPGTTLYFHANAGIDVHGRLLCNGDASNNIVLRGDRLDRMFDYLPYDNISGQWRGIRFYGESFGSKISFTDLHSASDAIVCDSSDVSRQKVGISSTSIVNSQGYGIFSNQCNISVENTLVANAYNDCVAVIGGMAHINNCTLAQYYGFTSNRGDALYFANINGKYKYPLDSLLVQNTIVTGFADDVIKVQKNDTAAFKYHFDNCLLRTPNPYDTINLRHVIFEDVEDTTAAGIKNFQLVETSLLRYDFHLTEKSLAIDAADTLTALPSDRDALPRDERPDIGCYEFVKKDDGENNDDAEKKNGSEGTTD